MCYQMPTRFCSTNPTLFYQPNIFTEMCTDVMFTRRETQRSKRARCYTDSSLYNNLLQVSSINKKRARCCCFIPFLRVLKIFFPCQFITEMCTALTVFVATIKSRIKVEKPCSKMSSCSASPSSTTEEEEAFPFENNEKM